MFAALSRWLTARAERRAAVASAVQHFEAAGRRAHRALCSVIGADARGAVVRVCYGNNKPPRRAWFVVGPGGAVTELSWDEAQQFGERPWR